MCYDALTTLSDSGGLDGTDLWIFQWSRSATKGYRVNWATREWFPIVVPALNDTGARDIRPSRMTVAIRNVSRADSVGGIVMVNNLSTPPKLSFDPGEANKVTQSWCTEMYALMASDKSTKTYGAQELRATHYLSAMPTKIIALQSMQKFHILGGQPDRFLNGIVSTAYLGWLAGPKFALSLSEDDNPLTTMAFFTAAGSNPQQYHISLHTQDALAFEPNTLGASQHRTPRTVNETTFGTYVSGLARERATMRPHNN